MRKVVAALAFAWVVVSMSPAAAAGLLQDLFGQMSRPAAPPVAYRYAPPPPQMRFVHDEGLRVSQRPALVRKAVKAPRPVARLRPERKIAQAPGLRRVAMTIPAGVSDRCKPETAATLIEQDTTLRVGDAYMTPEGLKVYRGFVDYKKAGVGRELRTQLDALDRGSKATGRAQPETARVAARAYVTNDSRTDRTSVDAQGRVIRVVGP